MSWFDEQIRTRKESDQKNLENSYHLLASIISKESKKDYLNQEHSGALYDICDYFDIEGKEIPFNIIHVTDQMEFLFRKSGLLWRRISLEGEWWKDIYGPILAEKKSGTQVALLPDKSGKYTFYDYDDNQLKPLNQETASELEDEAVTFYEALPQRKLTVKDLLDFLNKSFSASDIAVLVAIGLLITFIGMVTPMATEMIFSTVIPTGQSVFVYTFAILLYGLGITTFLFSIIRSVYVARIRQKMSQKLRSAIFGRVLGFPVEFFKDYRAGDLAFRISTIPILCETYADVILGTGLTALLSFIYLFQIFVIAPPLTFPAFISFALMLSVGVLSVYAQMQSIDKEMNAQTKLDGLVYSLLSGIQKIKLTGGEKRAFNKWAEIYAEKAEASYNPPLIVRARDGIMTAVSVLGLLFIYAYALNGAVSLPQFMAFNSVYVLVNTALLTAIQMASQIALIKPILKILNPVLETVPEVEGFKEQVHNLSGGINLEKVSFSYSKDGPEIIKDLSLRIKRGEYVAIVGSSGSGKSTLFRLLLGFETPQKGSIYYDGKNIEKLDKKSLRKRIGTVLQNGKLLSDSIFANIAISAPELTRQEAWEAAEIAGLADDIRAMPMEMNTFLSEGGGGISGGQKQRLLIARAIAPKPKILMLDEATSALDNLTQKKVADALAEMKATRIVIAHRLSTIKDCDRIIVLEKGTIVEDGTYDELVNAGGFFSKLVERQRIIEPDEDDDPLRGFRL